MTDLPTVMTGAGLLPTAPVDLRTRLVALVAATNPGYTADLPGTLIEDIASTDVAALVQCDQLRVELINSLTPHGANEFLLTQLGTIYGVPRGAATNTSVYVQFTGSVGFVIPVGFIVSDGSYQYVVQTSGVIGPGGTGNLLAIATQTGSWAVPANSVTNLVTSIPTGITVNVNNPLAGTPAIASQSLTEYRTQVLRSGLAASQGMARYLKTLLRNIPGVQERLISVRQKPPGPFSCGAWEVMVGGSGDSYQIASAIFNAIFDVSALVPSSINVTSISKANPGIVTTDINHLLTEGQVIEISSAVGMVEINNIPLTIHVIDSKTFSVGISTIPFATWVSGGVVTPNARNVSVYIDDYPDTYLIPFVIPPSQTVNIVVTWNTSAPNFVGAASVSAITTPALVDYINNIPAGQPIILYELENAFRDAVATILAPQLITRMLFSVSIDGIGVLPVDSTGVIPGDPESYLIASPDSIQVVQG